MSEQVKNLKDAAATLAAYSEWMLEYAAWWKKKYGHLSEAEFTALTNGSTPPPKPPQVPPS